MWSPAQRRLVIFAKAPAVGRTKTRLARDIGAVRAARFARRLTNAVIGRIGRDPRWWTGLWVTPDDQAVRGRWWQGVMARHPQGRGDLGARMLQALVHGGAGPVVLVGSDIPHLSSGLIESAFLALESHDAVFGPARDGGFWLVGFSGLRPIGNPFLHVRWSTAHALDDTLANLRPGLRVAMLPMLRDVDRGEDLSDTALKRMSV